MKFLKETLETATTTIHEDYVRLDENSLRVMLVLNSISNAKNLVPVCTCGIITELANISHGRFVKSSIQKLIDLKLIDVDGDYTKANNLISISIKNLGESKYGIISANVVVEAIKDLTYKELRVAVAYWSSVNNKCENNYVFPKNETLMKVLGDNKSYFEECKYSLINKGYIKKVACLYQFIIDKDKSSFESQGYFLKTGRNEVVDYDSFIKDMLKSLNRNDSDIRFAISKKSYLEKKYKDKKTELKWESFYFDDEVEVTECQSKLIATTESDLESNLDKLLDEKYEFLKGNKRLKDSIAKYGPTNVYDFLYSDSMHIENEINSIAGDEKKRVNVFMKCKFESLLEKFIEDIDRNKIASRNITDDEYMDIEDCMNKQKSRIKPARLTFMDMLK